MIIINGDVWNIFYVDEIHLMPGVLGACDKRRKTIYIKRNLEASTARKILYHEILHAFLYSYNIDIPDDKEEILANNIEIINEIVNREI